MGWVVLVNGLSLGVVKGIINVLWHFSQNQTKKIHNSYENTKDPKQPKQF